MASARQGQVRTHIDAPPGAVWALLANLEQMGEWSPDAYHVPWLGGAGSPAPDQDPRGKRPGGSRSPMKRSGAVPHQRKNSRLPQAPPPSPSAWRRRRRKTRIGGMEAARPAVVSHAV